MSFEDMGNPSSLLDETSLAISLSLFLFVALPAVLLVFLTP